MNLLKKITRPPLSIGKNVNSQSIYTALINHLLYRLFKLFTYVKRLLLEGALHMCGLLWCKNLLRVLKSKIRQVKLS